MEIANFQIYNASAGSGKTFTLVKSFLKLILSTKNVEAYKTLLAITFTNKAVNEMKERIINKLLFFATAEEEIEDPDQRPSKDPMFQQLAQELSLSYPQLQERSQNILTHILHNYAGFTITTIDGFNQRLIRSFAFDLKLNPNFEVFLETDDLLRLAIENLLKKTDESQLLTQILLEFSKDKIEEDKDWDIEAELFDISKLLTNENHYFYIKSLNNKGLEDFQSLKNDLKEQRKKLYASVKEAGKAFFSFAEKYELTSAHFTRGSLYNFFEKVKEEGLISVKKVSFDAQWFAQVEENPLYSAAIKKKEPAIAILLDENQDWIANLLQMIEKSYWWELFYRHLIKNVTLLAVLKSLQGEIEAIKEEENILPISDFNSIIHQTISNEPQAFIYEKIGTRHQHYFIDEFQDTSSLQWKNMIPLIEDAVHSENLNKQKGSLLLVGDAKQSIYRWRGGRAEQFIELYDKDVIPFHIEQQVDNLAYNYRSKRGIIAFNNDFFDFVAHNEQLFQTDRYRNLYQRATQEIPQREVSGGYVSIEFLEKEMQIDPEEMESLPEETDIYVETIERYIQEARTKGYLDKDICILSRRNKDCIEIAEKLAKKDYNVISSEALLLKNIPEIQFLLHLIAISLYENNEKEKIDLLFAYAKVKNLPDIHQFMEEYAHKPIGDFFSAMEFSLAQFQLYSFYEGIAYAIEVFALAKPSDAYLTQFLNVVYEYKNVRNGNIADFLTYWEERQDKLAISAPEGVNAITIMTIHKSKGLEFPMVIYAHVNDKLRSSKDTLWIAVSPQEYHGFEYLLMDDYSGLEQIETEIVQQQSEMELLDTINTMYVAMTRPKDLLYVISDLPKEGKDKGKIATLSEILKAYLQEKGRWEDTPARYTFGEVLPLEGNLPKETTYIPYKQRKVGSPSYTIVTQAKTMWKEENKEAIEKGNLLHEILSEILTAQDISSVLQQFFVAGRITESQRTLLTAELEKIVTHPLLKDYYTDTYTIYNEREWLTQTGEYLRPDRVAYHKDTNRAIIIDYKTGSDHPTYQTQLKAYRQTLEQMGWRVEEAFLVFIGEELRVKAL